MIKKIMKLIDSETGLMQCQICGSKHFANIRAGTGRYYRGSWQCRNGCKMALTGNTSSDDIFVKIKRKNRKNEQ